MSALLVAQALPIVVQAQTPRLNTCWPDFDYDGKPAQADDSFSRTIVAGSQRETAHYTAESKTMTATDGKLQIRLDGKNFKDYTAGEYSVELTNLSKTEPTGIVGDFRSLKLSVHKPDSAGAITVNVLRGSTCAATDFVPETFTIEAGKEHVLATTCGRSSNDSIPFLELNLDDKNGYLFAVGWTGTWKARFANIGKTVDVEIGVERTHFQLAPAETIRQPSITVFVRKDQTRREFKT
ncbi:MAG: hypothetical protein JW829_10430, partial [Pirellulales bacterium]|nr:hypothetical protein [Pirellulales bacterium]